MGNVIRASFEIFHLSWYKWRGKNAKCCHSILQGSRLEEPQVLVLLRPPALNNSVPLSGPQVLHRLD